MKKHVVFAGDSIIHAGPWQYWLPEHYVTNFAFPGHTTSDLAGLVNNVALSNPDLLVVMIGTNDFGKHKLPVEQVITNILDNANSLRKVLPKTPIIWSSLSPRSDEFSQSMIDVNERIKPAIEDLGIEYFDVFSLLKDSDKNTIKLDYCEDPDTFGLHLNNAGYEAWFKRLAPVLAQHLA